MRACCSLAFVALVMQQAAFARSHDSAEIDHYCSLLRTQMTGVIPFVFSGPEPWTELDEVPGEMQDQALAFVYTDGPAIRWVYVRILDDRGEWGEDIYYFFRQDGTIAKRLRRVLSGPANIEFESTTYYRAGAVFKETTHHHALHKGKQNSSEFVDPDAPEYLTVGDLPFPEIADLWRRLS